MTTSKTIKFPPGVYSRNKSLIEQFRMRHGLGPGSWTGSGWAGPEGKIEVTFAAGLKAAGIKPDYPGDIFIVEGEEDFVKGISTLAKRMGGIVGKTTKRYYAPVANIISAEMESEQSRTQHPMFGFKNLKSQDMWLDIHKKELKKKYK